MMDLDITKREIEKRLKIQVSSRHNFASGTKLKIHPVCCRSLTMLFHIASLSFAFAALVAPTTGAIEGLGVADLSVYNYSFETTVDDDCQYTYTFSFIHPEEFPIGTFGDDGTCRPGVMAPDGIPFNAGRWYYERLPDYVREATGLDHPSIDWNPCGHPSGGFLSPHYDLHIYTVSPEFRSDTMLCNLWQQTPVCGPDSQTTAEGLAFFNLTMTADRELINMPAGYEYVAMDAVQHMGMHAFLPGDVPATAEEWLTPTYVLCSYGGQINAIEPMLPLHFFSGDVDQFWEEKDIEYVEKTSAYLPTYLSAEFNSETKVVTAVFKGQSYTCKAEFEAAKAEFEGADDEASVDNEDDPSGASSLFPSLLALTALVSSLLF
jgi:hypothetical protein